MGAASAACAGSRARARGLLAGSQQARHAHAGDVVGAPPNVGPTELLIPHIGLNTVARTLQREGGGGGGAGSARGRKSRGCKDGGGRGQSQTCAQGGASSPVAHPAGLARHQHAGLLRARGAHAHAGGVPRALALVLVVHPRGLRKAVGGGGAERAAGRRRVIWRWLAWLARGTSRCAANQAVEVVGGGRGGAVRLAGPWLSQA